jgi:hypothetical protein
VYPRVTKLIPTVTFNTTVLPQPIPCVTLLIPEGIRFETRGYCFCYHLVYPSVFLEHRKHSRKSLSAARLACEVKASIVNERRVDTGYLNSAKKSLKKIFLFQEGVSVLRSEAPLKLELFIFTVDL